RRNRINWHYVRDDVLFSTIKVQRGSSTDEGTGSRPGVPDVPSDDSEEKLLWNSFDDEDVDEQTKGREEMSESEGESDEEETRQEEEESFDPIPRTPEGRVESIFTTASSSIVSLQTPTPIMTPSTIATITTSRDAPILPTTIPSIILENLPTFNSAFCFDERLKSLETTFSEYRQTNPFID
nr:hypothetical protein [Tanacetum cinerariifolium]